ncbi:MAG: hypothetical protein WC471_03165 [Candidatus Woesearchaeota archaeon]
MLLLLALCIIAGCSPNPDITSVKPGMPEQPVQVEKPLEAECFKGLPLKATYMHYPSRNNLNCFIVYIAQKEKVLVARYDYKSYLSDQNRVCIIARDLIQLEQTDKDNEEITIWVKRLQDGSFYLTKMQVCGNDLIFP